MAKFNKRDLERANNKELAKIAGWLKQAPKVVLQAAVTRTHSTVMQSQFMGGKMMHDSSNAAYNWQVSLDGSVGRFIDAKGVSPVGESGDQRTRTGKMSEVASVVAKRLSDDANKLDRAIWGAANIDKVSLVNPISGYYAVNANLDEAYAGHFWKQYATAAAQSAFDSWLSAGPKVDWSRHGKLTFGGGQ